MEPNELSMWIRRASCWYACQPITVNTGIWADTGFSSFGPGKGGIWSSVDSVGLTTV